MNKIISVSEATGGWIVRVISPTGAVVPLYCDGSFKKAIAGKEGCVRGTQEGFPAPLKPLDFQNFLKV